MCYSFHAQRKPQGYRVAELCSWYCSELKVLCLILFDSAFMSFHISVSLGWCATACRNARAWLCDCTFGLWLPVLQRHPTMSCCTGHRLFLQMALSPLFGISWPWQCHHSLKVAIWLKEWRFFCKDCKFHSKHLCFGFLFTPATWITSFIWLPECQTSTSVPARSRLRLASWFWPTEWHSDTQCLYGQIPTFVKSIEYYFDLWQSGSLMLQEHR